MDPSTAMATAPSNVYDLLVRGGAWSDLTRSDADEIRAQWNAEFGSDPDPLSRYWVLKNETTANYVVLAVRLVTEDELEDPEWGLQTVVPQEIRANQIALAMGLFASPAVRGRGLGLILVSRYIEDAKEAGIKFFIENINDATVASARTYERVGFERTAHMRGKENVWVLHVR